MVSITLWQTESDAVASAESGFLRDQFAKLGGLLAEPPRLRLCAVSTGAAPVAAAGPDRNSGEVRARA